MVARKPDLNKAPRIAVGYEDRIDNSTVKAEHAPKAQAYPECGCRDHVRERSTCKAYHLHVKGVPLVVLLKVTHFHAVKELASAFSGSRVRVTDSKEANAKGNPTKKDRFTARGKKKVKKTRY